MFLGVLQRNKAAMNELAVGQRVICKHKNGRYYQCDVVQLSKETFYEVNFDDGSFSDNLFPEDIVVVSSLFVQQHVWQFYTFTSPHVKSILSKLALLGLKPVLLTCVLESGLCSAGTAPSG